jgi:DNA-binding LacI/PurR family transcriptional regulator
MAEVGAAAGVTDRTVSNVLSGKVPVRPETRAAVLRAVDELGYRLNATARGLRTGRTGTITLALPDMGYDYFSQLAHAVMTEADHFGWAVTIVQTGARPEREQALLTGTDPQISDGLIIQPYAVGPENGHRALRQHDQARHRPPIVLLGDRIINEAIDHVLMDNTPAARVATEHLIATGRAVIGVIGPDPADATPGSGAVRLEGYRQALRQAGLPWRPELVRPAAAWRRAEGAAATDELLQAHPEVDALFCCNDDLALGAMYAVHRRGLRVPEDVAVVGFDNVTAATFSHPPLTTIDSGGPLIARTAVKLLAERLDPMSSAAPPRKVIADFHLVQRGSTAGTAVSAPDDVPRGGPAPRA